jgi:hypothetical protein
MSSSPVGGFYFRKTLLDRGILDGQTPSLASTALLFPSALAGLVGSNDPDWRSRFDAMIKYAVASGWSDAEGRVRAHIVRGSVT